jgi:sRNA-binding carbon storage regulator CsrA
VLVSACLCASPDIDGAAFGVAAEFDKLFAAETDNVRLQIYAGKREQVFRRSIMRNMAAKESKADILWMIDSDYLMLEGCLDALAASDFKGIAYPREVQIHRAHWLGDKEIARIKPGELFEPDLSLFETKKEKFAIGGLQIVDGDSARKYGYLDNTKWVQPVPDAQDFLDTKEDKAFRNFMIETVGPSTPLSLPNLFRFRHSESAFEPPENRLAQTAHKH